MRKLFLSACAAGSLALSAGAVAQKPTPELAESQSFQEFLRAAKDAKTESIIQITGDYHTSEAILKADKIVIADGATLTFDEINGKFGGLVAKEIVYSAPGYRVVVQRSRDLHSPAAAPGQNASGIPPKKPKAPHKNSGATGDQGYPGGVGAPGLAADLPPVYLATDVVTRQPGGTSDFIDMRLLFPGVDGGQGGKGGAGGKGGTGGDGGAGVDHVVSCAGGPGDGGDGGQGGKGGRGGDGSRGGNGADIYYVGSENALTELSYSRVFAPGGLPGRGGIPGNPGLGGDGGARGERTTWCHGGSGGSGGGRPSPSDLGYGYDSSTEGTRGAVTSVKYDVRTLF